jgi:UDP-N-acetylmuramoyl-L-alanyl-D-glutamate--2,6-diaminopimelate ligase
MKLSELINNVKHLSLLNNGADDPDISSIEFDSNAVRQNSLFCVIQGQRFDGYNFISDAVKKGAVALLSDREHPLKIAQVLVKDVPVRVVMNELARKLFDYPDKKLKVVAVTGTNGKTSVTKFFEAIAEDAGKKCLTIGTLSNLRTTPEGPDIFKTLSNAVKQGYSFCALEASSHGLKQGRVSGIEFDAAAFTNLSRDHLDYHLNMQDYFESKKLLFYPGVAKLAVVFDSNDYSKELINFIKANQDPRLKVLKLKDISPISFDGNRPTFFYKGRVVKLQSGGIFSAINAYIAMELASEFFSDEKILIKGVESLKSIEGRFEVVISTNNNIGQVVIDYAHSPDALQKAIESARALARGEVIVVFGCGGQRDKEKRPMMGQVAAEMADLVIITSDNPRNEDPQEIISDILAGINSQDAMVCVEPDRAKAIKRAVLASRPGDVVLIAGKGHEKYQEIKGEKIPFDDKAVVQEVLENHSRCA